MTPVQMEHVGLSVADLEAAIAWYRDCFGFEVVRRFAKAELEVEGALIRSGDCQLELLEPREKDPAASDRGSLARALRRTGANHFAIGVDSVASCFEALRAHGAELVTELVEERFFFCCDPDGTLIEVRQNPEPRS